MHNYPSQHTRISDKELEYIETAIKKSGTSTSDEDQPRGIPWKSILTSTPVWAVVIGDFGSCWALALFLTQLPTYMKNILGFSIKENGLISALPFIFRYAGAIFMSTAGDWLLTHKYLSIRSTRRIFGAIAMCPPALLLLGVSFSGCDWKTIVALLCAALFLSGAVTTSTIVNPADIAPNYSGTLFGLLNMTSTVAFFTVPVVTGVMTDGQQTLAQWQKLFWICVPIYLIAFVVFFIFVSGDVQPWNFARRRDSVIKKYTSERVDMREVELQHK
ncbi:sialin-like [Macrobrachium rosenbergii]|uniref:sialin-like n=1 Tax=Macrobrachium rosenbergii TaxID=79674 RepID=UPI0034D3A8E2